MIQSVNFHLRHGLPAGALTNEIATFNAFKYDSYFQHHMDFVQLYEKLWSGGDASAEAMWGDGLMHVRFEFAC